MKMTEELYDVIVPMTEANLPVFRMNVEWMKKNLSWKRIIVIGASGLKEACGELQVDFLNEDSLFPGMTLESVRNNLKNRIGETGRAGWYFQQFLKFAYCYCCEDEYYIVWDADTVPLHRISHLLDGHPVFTKKEEMEHAYFDTLERLFGGEVKRCGDFSFICENMIFHVETLKEMLDRILAQPGLSGDVFWERILSAVSDENLPGSGFSEFETYGNYVMTYHPQMYRLRTLKGMRKGAEYFGLEPTEDQLAWAAGSFDTIAFERWSYYHGVIGKICNCKIVQKLIPFSWITGLKMGISRMRERS